MAIYDIGFEDRATGQVLRFPEVSARNKKQAEEQTRTRANKMRLPAPPGSLFLKHAALTLTICNRMSFETARALFLARINRERRTAKYQAFCAERREELKLAHPEWSYKQRYAEVYMLAFEAFTPLRRTTPKALEIPQEIAAPGPNEQEIAAEDVASGQWALLSMAKSQSDRGGIQEDVDWVYQNLEVEWPDIPLTNIPSPGGIGLLVQAKEDKKWFLQTYHAKLLPTKAKIEAGEWSETDDSGIAEMCSRLTAEALEEAAV